MGGCEGHLCVIANAEVQVTSPALDAGLRTTTNSEGRFYLLGSSRIRSLCGTATRSTRKQVCNIVFRWVRSLRLTSPIVVSQSSVHCVSQPASPHLRTTCKTETF